MFNQLVKDGQLLADITTNPNIGNFFRVVKRVREGHNYNRALDRDIEQQMAAIEGAKGTDNEFVDIQGGYQEVRRRRFTHI